MAIFDPGNSFWSFIGKLTDVFGLSLCWFFLSLPVITCGAATTALYDSIYHCVRRSEQGAYSRFFRTFRESFKSATVVTAGLLVIGAVFLYALEITRQMAAAGAATAAVAYYAVYIICCIPLAVWLMSMFTLSRFSFKSGALFAAGAKLTAGFLPAAAVVTVAAVTIVRVTIILFPYSFGFPAFLPGAAAWLCTFPMERVFKKFLPPQEREEEIEDEI